MLFPQCGGRITGFTVVAILLIVGGDVILVISDVTGKLDTLPAELAAITEGDGCSAELALPVFTVTIASACSFFNILPYVLSFQVDYN